MKQWVCRCAHPDGGDVIEGRAAPVETLHEDFWAAHEAARKWYRAGPNGPVRDASVYRASDLRRREPVRVADVTATVAVAVTVTARRGMDGWWDASIVMPDGRAVQATYGLCVDEDDARAKASDWAKAEGYRVFAEVGQNAGMAPACSAHRDPSGHRCLIIGPAPASCGGGPATLPTE